MANVSKYSIAKGIIQAAQLYQSVLVGKTFMYVFDKQHIEVTYKTINFCHLTGVGTNLNAIDFYEKARQGTLLEKDFYFKNHGIRDVNRKVNHLIDMANMVTGECFMLEDVGTRTILLQHGVTNLAFSVCFDINVNATGQNTDFFYPRTLRHGDDFDKSRDVHTVTHIFCKRSDKKRYDNVLYIEKNATISALPREIKDKLGSHLSKGEKFIESCEYLFDESEQILSENPELLKEFLLLKQIYLARNKLTPASRINDSMTLTEKYNSTENYYNEICGIISFDAGFKKRYRFARNSFREKQEKYIIKRINHKKNKK